MIQGHMVSYLSESDRFGSGLCFPHGICRCHITCTLTLLECQSPIDQTQADIMIPEDQCVSFAVAPMTKSCIHEMG